MRKLAEHVLLFVWLFAVGASTVAQDAAPPGTTAARAKPVLAVIKFQDETGGLFMQGGVGRALTQMLTNEL
ncbi:MAG: hypothetical protein ABIP49_10755, partial [Lysobacterales bacterium]